MQAHDQPITPADRTPQTGGLFPQLGPPGAMSRFFKAHLWRAHRRLVPINHGYRYLETLCYNASMKGRIVTVEDDFWTERLPFFTAQFPTYYRVPQQVHSRFHASDERYFDGSHEIIPLTQRRGHRTYVMMHPYVLEPKFALTIGLYNQPRHYADQESPIGEVIGSNYEGFREAQVGNAQAWYYPA